MKTYIHESADVSKKAKIGGGSSFWNHVQVREGATIGKNCILSKGVYIDKKVSIGNNVKIQNYASIYYKSIIEDGVFIGPYVVLTNDKYPRAVSPSGKLKAESEWKVGKIIVRYGASIGTSSIILTNVEIGKFVLIGAGSVVTNNIPAHCLVIGNPAKIVGRVCKCLKVITKDPSKPLSCKKCKTKLKAL